MYLIWCIISSTIPNQKNSREKVTAQRVKKYFFDTLKGVRRLLHTTIRAIFNLAFLNFKGRYVSGLITPFTYLELGGQNDTLFSEKTFKNFFKLLNSSNQVSVDYLMWNTFFFGNLSCRFTINETSNKIFVLLFCQACYCFCNQLHLFLIML